MRFAILKLFNEVNWDRFELEDGGQYSSYRGVFAIHRYDGERPSILDNHPWRHIDDIRKFS